jgi:hypothetical protein
LFLFSSYDLPTSIQAAAISRLALSVCSFAAVSDMI